MSIPPVACSNERIADFLQGSLSDEDEQILTRHLDTCETCCRALEQQTAEADAWLEAENLLGQNRWLRTGANPTEGPDNEPSLQIRMVLDLLQPTDDPLMLGRIDAYEIRGVVGSGGMGVVLKAHDPSLDRVVAIKVLAPHLASSGAARQRFEREARAAAAVLHPNVIAIHSVSSEWQLPYLVMPFLRGETLQQRIDRQGALPLPDILRIGTQVAAGLAAAHDQGLIHRDIKPANVLLEDGVERVTITDFGLARAVDDATLTRSGVITGTPQYMSPEQACGEALDIRSDLFSLGSVLYALCTGHAPFRAETSFGVLRRITDQSPRNIRETSPAIPEWLCSLVRRLMARRADDRYATAHDVAELLEQCLAHVQQPLASAVPKQLAGEARREKRTVFVRRLRSAINGRRAMMLSALCTAIVLAGTLLWSDSAPPDISGHWSGTGWGQVELTVSEPGHYVGTYTDTYGNKPGTIRLQWSSEEQQFLGDWQEGTDRFGRISVRRHTATELRGAWRTSPRSTIRAGHPELADLSWTRGEMEPQQLPTVAENPPPLEGHVIGFLSNARMRISLGSDDGIREGTRLHLFHDFKSAGEIEITEVRVDESFASLVDMVDVPVAVVGDRVSQAEELSLASRIQGDWMPVLSVQDQRTRTSNQSWRVLRFGINRAVPLDVDADYCMHFELDESHSPARITIETESPFPNSTVVQHGVVAIEGDRLKLCLTPFDASDLQPPTELRAQPGYRYMELRRITPALMADTAGARDQQRIEVRLASEEPAEGLVPMPLQTTQRTIYVESTILISDRDILVAGVQEAGDTADVRLKFTAAGAERLLKATTENQGRMLAIIVDGRLLNAPIIRSGVSTDAVVSGNFTPAEARELAEALNGTSRQTEETDITFPTAKEEVNTP